MFFPFTPLSAIVAIGAAFLLDWAWPKAPTRRLTILAAAIALLGTIILLALDFAELTRSGKAPSPSPDAEGMVMAALMMLTPFILALNLLLGFFAARFTLRYLRGN